MSKSLFQRTSSFDQPKGPPPSPTPGSENTGLSPTQKLARQRLKEATESGPDLERWYRMVSEWCHPDTRRLSSASWASVPLEQLEELRDELYSHLH